MTTPQQNDIPNGPQALAFTDRPLTKVHKFYIVGEIKRPDEYTQWFETIRNAPETDIIVFHINSHGGDLFTTIQFLRIMSECKATIVASVEGACMSAATLIFLAANHWEISSHSMFMFHNYSTLTGGKGGEIYDSIVHERKWSQKLFKDTYSGFLTTDEITSILHNKDIWMSGEDVQKRLIEKGKMSAPKSKKAPTPRKTKKTTKTTTKRKTPVKKPTRAKS